MAEGGLVLGVDAGNTKTHALLVERDGSVVAWGGAGSGDIYAEAAPGESEQQVKLAVEAAIGGADLEGSVSHVAFRLAGIDWPEDERHWRRVIEHDWPGLASFSLLNDGFAGIRLGYPEGVGLAITAGTGGAFAVRSVDGREFCLGMRGPHQLAAKGLGIAGYQAAALAEMGVAEPTVLVSAYTGFFGVATIEEIVHMLTGREHPPVNATLARCARLVTDAATAGDDVAMRIVGEQAELLARYARATAARVGVEAGDRMPIVLGGSVLRAPGSPVAERLRELLANDFCASPIVTSDLPEVCGAALDALAEAGADPASAAVAMRATLPEAPVNRDVFRV